MDGVSCFCRDLVHRQTSMAAIGHLALGVYGFGCEDALTHLMNHLWPNVFETSPHVVQAFMSAIEGMRLGLGPSKVLQYTCRSAMKLRYIIEFINYFDTELCKNCILLMDYHGLFYVELQVLIIEHASVPEQEVVQKASIGKTGQEVVFARQH